MSLTEQEVHERLKDRLTEQQYNAAIDPCDKVLCLACAGSGKSRTLAFRIAHLISAGSDPRGIVAFTFTEKAAESLKRRVAEALETLELPPSNVGLMYVGTIHSYCQYLLGQYDARYRQFDVLDRNRLVIYLISRFNTLGLRSLQTQKGLKYFQVINEVADAWNVMNDEMLLLSDIIREDDSLGNTLATLKDTLNRSEYVDFSSMIRITADYLIANDPRMNDTLASIQHLLVDEYQDVNPSQEALISGLAQRADSLFVVGDDDQAIYGWRGADVSNILTFKDRYPNCTDHELTYNFRSSSPIVDAASNFVAAELSASRLPKNAQAFHSDGVTDFRNLWFGAREDEAAWIADTISSLLGMEYIEKRDRDGNPTETRGLTKSDFAILFRSIKSSHADTPKHTFFMQQLDRAGIRYTVESEGSLFDRPYPQAIREAFELLRTPSPDRNQARDVFDRVLLPCFPNGDFNRFAQVISAWNHNIHAVNTGVRRRVFIQNLYYDILDALNVRISNFDDTVLRDLGQFSSIMTDIESVYVSIDSSYRYQEVLNFLSNTAESGYDVSNPDTISRPDAVTISTIHKAKGLEYPVVFIVDLVNRRFPGDNKRYRGQLPTTLMSSALSRGAYGTSRFDEARLFYTAVTRAERFLYLTGSAVQPDNKTPKKPSVFKSTITHDLLSENADGFTFQINRIEPRRRVEESDIPTSYSEIKDYLTCPYMYKLKKRFGFNPAIPELFGFGQTTHAAISKLHERFTNTPPTAEEAAATVDALFHLKHAFESSDPVNRPGAYERARDSAKNIVRNYVETYGADFERIRESEARFELKIENAIISGSIDLLLKENPQGEVIEAQVVDFKSMDGPDGDDSYDWRDMALQVQLYAHAAKEVLQENATSGSVHFLKSNERMEVPVEDAALASAIDNIKWAVDGVIASDFPRRPSEEKCSTCDKKILCTQTIEDFNAQSRPGQIHVPDGARLMARTFD